MSESKKHRWKNSWPGNFCLDCGEPDPLEEAVLVNCVCVSGCEKCFGTGCVLSKVKETACDVGEFCCRNLQHKDFSETDFEDCQFEACALHRAFFLGCQINHSRFTANDSAGVCFESAAITDTAFEGDEMPGANFCWTYLRDVKFVNCDLTGADFSKAVFSNVVFEKCILKYANFAKSNHKDAKFVHCLKTNAIGLDS